MYVVYNEHGLVLEPSVSSLIHCICQMYNNIMHMDVHVYTMYVVRTLRKKIFMFMYNDVHWCTYMYMHTEYRYIVYRYIYMYMYIQTLYKSRLHTGGGGGGGGTGISTPQLDCVYSW